MSMEGHPGIVNQTTNAPQQFPRTSIAKNHKLSSLKQWKVGVLFVFCTVLEAEV